jgi:rubredoxin
MDQRETANPPAWICTECGFVYDPATGDLESNIHPGIPFEKLPDDWLCPVCSVTRDRFRLFDSQL